MKSTPHPQRRIALLFCLVILLVGLTFSHLVTFFSANPFFNSIILGVLLFGFIHAFRQLALIDRETGWLNRYRRNQTLIESTGQPVLLASVHRWYTDAKTRRKLLSSLSYQILLDSVSLRLEESRDLLRYLSGLSIFLGLLGTFWGLLTTIGSVTDIIGTLNVGGDAIAMFSELKAKIQVPLGGMATSFSTSLFGLASSLIIGFLDLQTGHAQNLFFAELEAWLSGLTQMNSGHSSEHETSAPHYIEALLEETSEGLEKMQRALLVSEKERQESREHMVEMNRQIGRLADAVLGDLREREALRTTLDDLRQGLKPLQDLSRQGLSIPEDLRTELRLMTRTLGGIIESSRSRDAE